ncbi:MAG: hypothetical protein FWE50_01075 [Alphaproteobacteria bacterium]|nr:hypothetical protein [Alphaproteobacteria bacterium]
MLILEQFYDLKQAATLARDRDQQLVWVQNDRGADEAFAKKIYEYLNHLASKDDHANFRPVHIGCKKDYFKEKDNYGIKGYGWQDIILKAFKIYEAFPNDLHILIGGSGIKTAYANKHSDDLLAESPVSKKQCRLLRELNGFQILIISTDFFPGPFQQKKAAKAAQAFVESKKQETLWFGATHKNFFENLRGVK